MKRRTFLKAMMASTAAIYGVGLISEVPAVPYHTYGKQVFIPRRHLTMEALGDRRMLSDLMAEMGRSAREQIEATVFAECETFKKLEDLTRKAERGELI